jgi:hypothetical protein
MPVAQHPQVDTRDVDEARMRLSDIYCPHKLTMSGGGRGFECRRRGRADHLARVGRA